ncbi:hypothetical protein FRX31_013445 [Thalictrum thalictroides]|uniref:Uncharacterized protein n=1 Tax=Thalictrum thalictroides TaxID=46969 RepID=A0A7J6WHX7_THATH|nr:hypothetical protein FRX31_013445 [Thalictrum thalictroides]
MYHFPVDSNLQAGDQRMWNVEERVRDNTIGQTSTITQTCSNMGLQQNNAPNQILSPNQVILGLQHSEQINTSIETTYDTMYGLNTYLSPKMIDPSLFSAGAEQRGGTLTINEPTEGATTQRRGRGRPPGLLNKFQKLQKDLKGKGKAVQEHFCDYVQANKKRKLLNEDAASSLVAYVPDEPQVVQNQRNRLTNLREEEQSYAIDLVSQMLSNPSLTSILIKKRCY